MTSIEAIRHACVALRALRGVEMSKTGRKRAYFYSIDTARYYLGIVYVRHRYTEVPSRKYLENDKTRWGGVENRGS